MDIENIFEYHAPVEGDGKKVKYAFLRQHAKTMAQAILDSTPACADQTAAIRKLREAVMTANAAIALDGKL